MEGREDREREKERKCLKEETKSTQRNNEGGIRKKLGREGRDAAFEMERRERRKEKSGKTKELRYCGNEAVGGRWSCK